MRAQKVSNENFDQIMFESFSKLGYDGVSMDLLSKATGLKKASLYHRFPNGKKEMALHVLKIVHQWILGNIVSPVKESNARPDVKLRNAMAAIDQLYNGGADNCLLRTLTVGADADDFKDGVTECFNLLATGFAVIAADFGASPQVAKQKARHTNLLIQGSLVLAGATNDKSYFKNSLKEIATLLKSSE